MSYIIKRVDQGGGYVAEPGSAKAYTRSRDCARRFKTVEAADADRCKGNEVVLDEYTLAIVRGVE